MEKRQRGRPRKQGDAEPFWHFVRLALLMCVYDESRETGDKHSVAIRFAVDFVKQQCPDMPVSETELRRVLGRWRPRGSGVIFRFERSALSEEQLQRRRWIHQQLAQLQDQKKELRQPTGPDCDPMKITSLKIRIAARPSYPRHNGISKE